MVAPRSLCSDIMDGSPKNLFYRYVRFCKSKFCIEKVLVSLVG